MLFSALKASFFSFRSLFMPFAFQLEKPAEKQKQTGP
jgi:hypothetical protein